MMNYIVSSAAFFIAALLVISAISNAQQRNAERKKEWLEVEKKRNDELRKIKVGEDLMVAAFDSWGPEHASRIVELAGVYLSHGFAAMYPEPSYKSWIYSFYDKRNRRK